LPRSETPVERVAFGLAVNRRLAFPCFMTLGNFNFHSQNPPICADLCGIVKSLIFLENWCRHGLTMTTDQSACYVTPSGKRARQARRPAEESRFVKSLNRCSVKSVAPSSNSRFAVNATSHAAEYKLVLKYADERVTRPISNVICARLRVLKKALAMQPLDLRRQKESPQEKSR